MDKAEERALECYPSLTNSFDRSKRLVYRNGYHQAEKDLALTWEDMQKIYEIICGIDAELESLPYRLGYQEYWEEVLTRFKQLKEESHD